MNIKKYNFPLVDIGLPIYNGEAKIAMVIESILCQTYSNFRLIISDNFSSDETENIIKRYVSLDSRITYYRQNNNIGGEGNFKYLFHKSKAKYFMWAAADDIRSNDFLEKNIHFLEKNTDYVASTLRTKFEGGYFDENKLGDKSLHYEDPIARCIKHLSLNWITGLHANGRFYSLIRRDALQGAIKKDWGYLGADWMIVSHLLSIGKINRINEGFSELGKGGASNTQDLFSVHRASIKDFFFPFNRLSYETWDLMTFTGFHQKFLLLLTLLNLNIYGFFIQLYIKIKRGD